MASEAEVNLVIDTTDTLPELQQDLQRIVNTAENTTPPVGLDAALDSVRSGAVLRDDLLRMVGTAEAAADPIGLNAELDANTGELRTELAAVVERLESSAPEIDIQVDVDRDGEGSRGARALTSALGTLGRTVPSVVGGVTGLGVASAGALSAVAALAASIESILPASALAVSGMTTLALVGGTVAVAFHGVGDAIEAAFDPEAKPEDLAKAMEGLAPTARAFVEELRSMKGEFGELKEEVQQNLFVGFDNALKSLSRTVLPQVRKALANTAVQLNRMALGAADAAVVLAQNGTLGRALEGSRKGLENLNKVPGQFVTGLGQIGAAAAPAFDRVTKAAAGAATKISERLAAAFESGALESAIDGAVDSIAQIGRVVGNVFEGLGNIFETLNAQGEGLFSVLEKITAAFAEVTASQGFTRALEALARVADVLVEEGLKLLVQALELLGPIFERLGPPVEKIIKLLGDSLGRVLEKLGPVLVKLAEAFEKLVPVIEPFVVLATDLLVAVLPGLIPLFETLGKVFEQIAPFAKQLAENIGVQILPVLQKLAEEVLPELLPLFAEMAEKVFPKLTEILIKLEPSLTKLGVALADLLVQLVPLAVEVARLTFELSEKLAPVLGPLISLIVLLVEGALKLLHFQLVTFVTPAIEILTLLLQGRFREAWEKAKDAVSIAADKIGGVIERMKNEVVRILGDLGNQARAKLNDLVLDAVNKLTELGNRARDIMGRLPGIILSAIGNLGNLLVSAGADLIQGLINGISGKLGRLREIAGQVADTVSGSVKDLLGISSPSKVMMEVGGDTMDGLLKGIEDKVPDLRKALQGVASLAPSFALPNGQTLQLPQFNQAAPNVQVFIGNEQLSGHVDARIARNNQARDLLTTRGVRR